MCVEKVSHCMRQGSVENTARHVRQRNDGRCTGFATSILATTSSVQHLVAILKTKGLFKYERKNG